MKKIKMARDVTLTFEEGCNKYLENSSTLKCLLRTWTSKSIRTMDYIGSKTKTTTNL